MWNSDAAPARARSRRLSRAIAAMSPSIGDRGRVAAGAGAEDADLAGVGAGDRPRRSAGRSRAAKIDACVDLDRRDPGGQRSRRAIVLGVRDLADRRAALPRPREVGGRDRRRDERVVDLPPDRRAGRTPARTESPAWRGRRRRRDPPTDPPRRSRARARRAPPSSSVQPVASICDRHGVGGAVQDRDQARDAIAGEPFADRAHDRHRAADRRFEAQLPALPRGERRAALRRGARSPACWR